SPAAHPVPGRGFPHKLYRGLPTRRSRRGVPAGLPLRLKEDFSWRKRHADRRYPWPARLRMEALAGKTAIARSRAARRLEVVAMRRTASAVPCRPRRHRGLGSRSPKRLDTKDAKDTKDYKQIDKKANGRLSSRPFFCRCLYEPFVFLVSFVSRLYAANFF